MLTQSQWRSFDFFNVTQVSLPDGDTHRLFENNEISSVCAGSESLFLGSSDGSVSVVGKNWNIVNKFQAHNAGSVTQMRQVEGTSYLVTVAVSFAIRLIRQYNDLTACIGRPE